MQPVSRISAAVRDVDSGVLVHTDAVQAFNSQEINVDDLGVDLLSLAAHKFGGPRGVGILYVRAGTTLEPVLHGGGQELGLRSGTHNVMGAVGMSVAARIAVEDRIAFRFGRNGCGTPKTSRPCTTIPPTTPSPPCASTAWRRSFERCSPGRRAMKGASNWCSARACGAISRAIRATTPTTT